MKYYLNKMTLTRDMNYYHWLLTHWWLAIFRDCNWAAVTSTGKSRDLWISKFSRAENTNCSRKVTQRNNNKKHHNHNIWMAEVTTFRKEHLTTYSLYRLFWFFQNSDCGCEIKHKKVTGIHVTFQYISNWCQAEW